MTTCVKPAEDDEAFLDATVGLDPALIEAEPRQAPADRFVVDDGHKADWALRKLGQLDAQKRERAAFVAAEIERLQAWQAYEDRQAARFADYLTMLLRQYDDQLKAEGKVSARHKGYRLPHGILTARQSPIEWEVDEATLLAWAGATAPETLVRVSKAPAWNVITPQLIPARDAPRVEATMAVIDTRAGEVRVVPVPGVWVKAGPEGTICVIDTDFEASTLYADAHRFDIEAADPPFEPDKFSRILKALGPRYDVLVLDTGTHEWTGEGGAWRCAIARRSGSRTIAEPRGPR